MCNVFDKQNTRDLITISIHESKHDFEVHFVMI